jgi:dTDP-4-dehydrorhamnose 3,5-epimerase
VAEGLGHAFCAITPTVTVGYLCNEAYAPTREHGVHPLDPALDLPWPSPDVVLSPKDAAAPLLADAVASGLVPTYDSCRNWYHGKSAT